MCRINPKVDIVFKKLFGSEENKDLLLSLINAVLPENEQITSLILNNPYNLSDYITGKLTILDIKATDENGKIYDIEMQIGEQGYYGRRALYYWGKTYTNQIDSGEMYSKLKKTIVISILDFKYFNDEDRFHRAIVAKDRDTNEFYDKLDYFEMHFVELPKFKKELPELHTALDRWATFLTKAYEFEKDAIPEELASMPEVKKAIEQLDTIYLDKKEQEIYEAEQKALWDEKEKIRTAEEKIRTAEEQGIELEKFETAKKMSVKGYSKEDIAEMTGLSIEQIEKL